MLQIQRGQFIIRVVKAAGMHDGDPDTRRTYWVCENGQVDVSKRGRKWWSTPRRLLNPDFQPREKSEAAE